MALLGNRIFSEKILNRHVAAWARAVDEDHLTRCIDVLRKWNEAAAGGSLDASNETSVDGRFIVDFFCEILGYKDFSRDPNAWTVESAKKTLADGTKADGALGFFSTSRNDIRAVIELKGSLIPLDERQKRPGDSRTPVEQAFSYAPKCGPKCEWVVVSNFRETRLYRSDDSTRYESFSLSRLVEREELLRFLFLMQRDRLITEEHSSPVGSLYTESVSREQTITKDFYSDFKKLRENLYRNIAHNNSSLSSATALEKTQKILNRYLFVCFCEDRGLLPSRISRRIIESSRSTLRRTNTSIWDELRGLFSAMNLGEPNLDINKFNGGLFAEDTILEEMMIGDDALLSLLQLSEYDFDSDLNVNILGYIFERSIADLDELRGGTQESKERGAAKRKKQGIFYTSALVTRYMVDSATKLWKGLVREELRYAELPELSVSDLWSIATKKRAGIKGNKKVEVNRIFWQNYSERLEKIRILDPACGSGAFLNQAFDQLLLEGHEANKNLQRLSGGNSSLFDLDRRILKENLFGVDLSLESVDITKLSLWIKTADRSKALTALDKNIRVGDSVINDESFAGDLAFDWEKQFATVMEEGGFDIIVGNPPYVRHEAIKHLKRHFEKEYDAFRTFADLYVYFIERSLYLLKEGGVLSLITSNKYMKADYGAPLRQMLSRYDIQEIIDFGELRIFEDASTFPAIITLIKRPPTGPTIRFCQVESLDFVSLHNYVIEKGIDIPRFPNDSSQWVIGDQSANNVLREIEQNHPQLSSYEGCEIRYGIKTGLNEVFVINSTLRTKLISEDPNSAEIIKPYASGDDVRKYRIERTEEFLIFTKKGVKIDRYPAILDYLSVFKERLTPGKPGGRRQAYYDIEWYELQDTVAYFSAFDNPKIVYPIISKRPRFTLDREGYYLNDKTFIIPIESYTLLAILNSKLCWYYLAHKCSCLGDPMAGGRLELRKVYLDTVPIPTLDREEVFRPLVESAIDLSRQIDAERKAFLTFVKEALCLSKISRKLEDYAHLDWKSFLKGLKVSEKKVGDSLETLYRSYSASRSVILKLEDRLTLSEAKLEDEVFRLYNVRSDTRKIISTTVDKILAN